MQVGIFHCDVCEFAKHHCVTFPSNNKRYLSPSSLIHYDIWGLSKFPIVLGAKWFVSFIDDCTRATWIFLSKHKSDVSSVFHNFYRMVQNQFGVCIKSIRMDNVQDYFNQILSPFLQKEGIVHHSSRVNTPQQNGVAEQKNRHLLKITRAILF